MALRETAMTAPLDQQGEPWAANGRYVLIRHGCAVPPSPKGRQGVRIANQCEHWFAMTCVMW